MTKAKGGFKRRPDGKLDTGRPTAFTPETISKLEEAFMNGATDIEACLIADVSTTALYNYQLRNPSFVERKQKLKEQPAYQARKVIIDKIHSGDADTAKWYLERKKKAEFSTRQELTGEDGAALVPNIEITPVAVLEK